MKRAIRGTAAILPLFALLLCAACGDDTVTFPTRTPVPTYPPVSVTLDQAKSRAPYLLLPSYLPAGVKLVSLQQDSAAQVNGAPDRTTRLNYQGAGVSFQMEEEPEPADVSMEFNSLPVGDKATATRVVDNVDLSNGNSSSMRVSITAYIRNDVEDEMVLQMLHKSHVFISIDGNLTRDDIVKVAESLQ